MSDQTVYLPDGDSANDWDPGYTVSGAANSDHIGVVVNADGTVDLNPLSGFVGTETLTLTGSDGLDRTIDVTVVANTYDQALSDFQNNGVYPGDYDASQIVALPNGNHAVFADYLPSTGGTDIVMQIYDLNGAVAAGMAGPWVNPTQMTSGNQTNFDVSVSPTGDGHMVLTWYSDTDTAGQSNPGLYFRLIGQDGSFLTDTVGVPNTGGTVQDMDVTYLNDGKFVISWVGDAGTASSTPVVFDYVYNADGSQYTTQPTELGSGQEVVDHTVTPLADGGALVVSVMADGSIQGQGHLGSGTTFQGISAADAGTATAVTSTTLADGGFVVAWQTTAGEAVGDGDGSAICAQVFNADGSARSDIFLVNQWDAVGDQTAPVITALPNGGFFVGYDTAAIGSSDRDVHGREYDANGVRAGSLLSLATGNADQHGLSLSPGTDGNIHATYDQAGQGVEAISVRARLGGSNGNDLLVASSNGDGIDGGDGNDTLLGGAGNDGLGGGNGDDTLIAGAGDDYLLGGAGNDVLIGGAGFDGAIYQYVPAEQLEIVDLGNGSYSVTDLRDGSPEGTDTLTGVEDLLVWGGRVITPSSYVNVAPTTANTTIQMQENAQYVFQASDFPFSDANSWDTLQGVTLTQSGGGGSLWLGGVALTGSTTVTRAQIDAGQLVFIPERNEAQTGYASISFNVHDDSASSSNATLTVDVSIVDVSLEGTAGNDALVAGSGNDTLYGYGGNDTLQGGAGNDLLDGGANNDSINGGAGNDSIDGGTGNDVIYAGNGDDYVFDSIGGDDTIYGEDGADYLNGCHGNDVIHGGSGNDTIRGVEDNDLLYGDGGDDDIRGGVGADTLYGGDGNDTLDGGADNDLLYGGNGDDVLTGGEGADTLSGGEGNDTIDGGNGDDTVIFDGSYDDYTVTDLGGGQYQFTDHRTGHSGHTTTIINIHHLHFSDRECTLQEYLNDEPTSSDASVMATEDTPYTFAATDFPFADTDSPNGLAGVRIDSLTLATGDSLTLNGQAVVAGEEVSLADLQAGNLVYQAAADAWGAVRASFTFSVSDGIEYSLTPSTMSVGVDPVNDPVVIDSTSTVTGAATEQAANEDGLIAVHSQNGTILFTDADTGDSHTAAITAAPGDAYGTLTLDSVLEANGDGSVGWTYEVTAQALDPLADGQTVVETFTITVDDGNGGAANQDVSVTLTGANDVPVVTSGVQAGDVIEDGTLTASGQMTVSDVDLTDSHTFSDVTGVAAAHGSFTVDSHTGDWNYTLNNDDAAVQALGNGDSLTETFTIEADDGHGGTANQDVIVTIHGTNDAPIASDGTVTGLEDLGYNLTVQDFGYSDAEGDALAGIEIENLPTVGTLLLNGQAVNAGTFVDTANLDSLTYVPVENEGTVAYASFGFKASDGQGLSGNTATMTIDITPRNEEKWGSNADDLLVDGVGNDTLHGLDGNDTLIGGVGADSLDGGNGTDTADYSASSAGVYVSIWDNVLSGGDAEGDSLNSIENVIGSSFADQLFGNGGANLLDGGAGNDTIGAGDGSDTLYGGNGNDSLSGSAGDDVLVGGAGADTLDGGDGTDTADYSASGAGVYVSIWDNVLSGGDAQGDSLSGIENVIGSSFADQLYGNGGANLLDGGDGNDSIAAGDGNDTLLGGNGNDSLYGRAGNDWLAGGAGADMLDGGNGDDSLNGNAGDDLVQGGSGNDSLYGSDGMDTLFGDVGDDSLNGGNNSDTLLGADGTDTLQGEAGNDALDGGAGNDILTGGAGNDTFAFGEGWGTDTVTDFEQGTDKIDLALVGVQFSELTISTDGTNTQISYGSDTIVLSGFTGTLTSADFVFANLISGTTYADTLTGTANIDRIDGGNSNDSISGAAGSDHLYGGLGYDTLNGDDGHDTLSGGGGNDLMDGGTGNDDMSGGDGSDVMTGGDGYDTLHGDGGFDTLTGGLGADELYGDDGNDSLTGGGGNDLMDGGTGNDDMSGGDGSDVMTGGDGYDTIHGDGGFDTITGGLGADELYGDGGNDSLTGGGGNDLMDGGAGNDDMSGGDGSDVMTGGDGYDTIHGDGGFDTLTGGLGADELYGDDGNDSLTGGGGNDLMDGGTGSDYLSGGDGSDVMTGGTGFDTLYGDGGFDTLSGGNGDDALYGGSGNDKLDGGIGSDVLTGGNGDDDFIFGVDWGTDTVTDFQNGLDRLDLSSSGLTYGDLSIVQQGSDVLISDANGDSILLTGIDISAIDQSDFVF